MCRKTSPWWDINQRLNWELYADLGLGKDMLFFISRTNVLALSLPHLSRPSMKNINSVKCWADPWQGKKCFLFNRSGNRVLAQTRASHAISTMPVQGMLLRSAHPAKLADAEPWLFSAWFSGNASLEWDNKGYLWQKTTLECPLVSGATLITLSWIRQVYTMTPRTIQCPCLLQLKPLSSIVVP